MITEHLTDDELDRLLAGEGLPAGRATHVGECLPCRRRRDEVVAAIAGAVSEDPDEAARARVRAAALERWGAGETRRFPWRWVAVAAVLLLAVLLPAVGPRLVERPSFDAEAVLIEVDEVLARDPLAAVASEDMVATLVGEAAESEQGGRS